MQAALLDFCYAIQIFPKTNPKMWRRRRRYVATPVSHSSGLDVLFPLSFRCASPPSTNLSLVLPSLACLIPPQSCICCLQRMYLLGLITFAFLQQVRVNGGKQRRVFEYLASLGLLFHLYVAGLRPLLSPCHTCIPHTRSAFFLWILDLFRLRWRVWEFRHRFQWDRTQVAFVTKGDWHSAASLFRWQQNKARRPASNSSCANHGAAFSLWGGGDPRSDGGGDRGDSQRPHIQPRRRIRDRTTLPGP